MTTTGRPSGGLWRGVLRAGAASVVLGWGCVAGGCSSVTVDAKVIEGSVSFVGVVDKSDARLKGAGIAGADLKVKSKPETGTGTVVAEGLSGDGGDASLPLMDKSALKAPVGISVRKDGYLGADNVLTLPGPERRILVVLKRAPGR